ncbi:unnamed protein product, partial [Pleuronectes platessa]
LRCRPTAKPILVPTSSLQLTRGFVGAVGRLDSALGGSSMRLLTAKDLPQPAYARSSLGPSAPGCTDEVELGEPPASLKYSCRRQGRLCRYVCTVPPACLPTLLTDALIIITSPALMDGKHITGTRENCSHGLRALISPTLLEKEGGDGKRDLLGVFKDKQQGAGPPSSLLFHLVLSCSSSPLPLLLQLASPLSLPCHHTSSQLCSHWLRLALALSPSHQATAGKGSSNHLDSTSSSSSSSSSISIYPLRRPPTTAASSPRESLDCVTPSPFHPSPSPTSPPVQAPPPPLVIPPMMPVETSSSLSCFHLNTRSSNEAFNREATPPFNGGR